jgi:hypothetical protein
MNIAPQPSEPQRMPDHGLRSSSIPARAIALLNRLGPLAQTPLADMLETLPRTLPAVLEFAIKRGLIHKEKRSDGLTWFSIGDGVPIGAKTEEPMTQELRQRELNRRAKPSKVPDFATDLMTDGTTFVRFGTREVFLGRKQTVKLMRDIDALANETEDAAA